MDSQLPEPAGIQPCALCGKPAPLRCGACRRAWYCGKGCQQAHWRLTHKKQCKAWATAARVNQMAPRDARELQRELEDQISKLSIKDAIAEIRKAEMEVSRLRKAQEAVKAKLQETSDESLEAQSLAAKAQGIAAMAGAGTSGGGKQHPPEYAKEGYWEERYRPGGKGLAIASSEMKTYEWYQGYKDIRPLVREATRCDTKCRVLEVGCGNSTVGEDMCQQDHYQDVTCIDVAPSVVSAMQARAVERGLSNRLRYQVMDGRSLSFPDSFFSCVLDKGTFDAVMSDPSGGGVDNVRQIYSEVMRVLQVGGRFLVISTMTLEVFRTVLDGLLPSTQEGEGHIDKDVFVCRPLPTEYRGMLYAFLITKPEPPPADPRIRAAQEALQEAMKEQEEALASVKKLQASVQEAREDLASCNNSREEVGRRVDQASANFQQMLHGNRGLTETHEEQEFTCLEGYTWSQTAQQVIVDIPIDEGLGKVEARHIRCDIGTQSLKLAYQGIELVAGQLEGPVLANQCTWSLVEGRSVCLNLVKAFKDPWPGAIKGHTNRGAMSPSIKSTGEVSGGEGGQERREAHVEVTEGPKVDDQGDIVVSVGFTLTEGTTRHGDYLALYEHHVEGDSSSDSQPQSQLLGYLDFVFADEEDGATSGELTLRLGSTTAPKIPVVARLVNRYGQVLGSSPPFHMLQLQEGNVESCSYLIEAQAQIRRYHLYIWEASSTRTKEGSPVSGFMVKRLGPQHLRVSYRKEEERFQLSLGPLEWGFDEAKAELLVMDDHLCVRLPFAKPSSSPPMDISDVLDTEVGRLAAKLDRGLTVSPTGLSCRFCESDLVPAARLKAYRALPSERLDDVTDFLLCYKQSLLPLSSAEILARVGLGLVGESYVMVHRDDARGVEASGNGGRSVQCRRCRATVGVMATEEEGGESGIRLWLHRVLDGQGILGSYNVLTYLASIMRAAAKRHKRYRFRLTPDDCRSAPQQLAVEIKILGGETSLASSSSPMCASSGSTVAKEAGFVSTLSLKPSLKVLHRAANNSDSDVQQEEQCHHDHHDSCDAHVGHRKAMGPAALEVPLPYDEWQAVSILLHHTSDLLPPSMHLPFQPYRLSYIHFGSSSPSN